MNPRRLYRSTRDRQLAGVAAGMAEYLDVDPTVVRILWILAALFSGGLLILAYIILAFVIPEAPFFTGAPYQGWTPPAGGAPSQGWSAATGPAAPAWSPDWQARAEAERRRRDRGPGAAVIVGTILVVLGAIALVNSVVPGWAGAAVFGPALVIALGAALLVASVRRRDAAPADAGAFGQASYAAPAAAAGQGPAASSAPAAPAAQAPTEAPAPPAAPVPPEPAAGSPIDADDDADATIPVDLGTAGAPIDQPDTDAR